MSTINTIQQIKLYAREDANSIANEFEKKYNLPIRVKGIEFYGNEKAVESGEGYYEATLHYEVGNDSSVVTVSINYSSDDENIYSSQTVSEVAKQVKQYYDSQKGIKASTRYSKRRITAADEDILDDPEGFEDTLDDLADSVEEVQDQVDDIVEDDVTIDINNNIDGHYIAECETCNGIFISAVIESDQEIDHITGICPLCQKETNQYLKWVIKSVND